MDKIWSKFLQIEHKRHESYIEHNLIDVLIMVMGAVISGITELADMMVYFASKKEFYKNNFGIENYPSKPTLSLLLNMLDIIWGEDASGILSENGNKTINSFRKLALLAHKRYIAAFTKILSIKGNVLSTLLNDSILLRVIKNL